MSLFLQRIDSAPLNDSDLSPEFRQWIAVLIDTLNEIIPTVQDSFNFLTAPSYTASEIAAMSTDLENGVFLYDTTNNVYVGKQSGVLVKFTTTAYP